MAGETRQTVLWRVSSDQGRVILPQTTQRAAGRQPCVYDSAASFCDHESHELHEKNSLVGGGVSLIDGTWEQSRTLIRDCFLTSVCDGFIAADVVVDRLPHAFQQRRCLPVREQLVDVVWIGRNIGRDLGAGDRDV